jgi:GMP synthase-like glutamine amidotransferase
MTLKIGILDFNPDKSPDLREYPRRISYFFPRDVDYRSLLFRNNPDLSPYDALFLSGSKLSATLYERMVDQGRIEGRDYEDVDRVAERLARYKGHMFGICFGSQLMAHVMGGRLGRLNKTEAGYLSHTLTTEGQNDEIFGYLPRTFHGAHLHRDYVDQLPCGSNVSRADVLATRNGFIHAYRVVERDGIIRYGIQPHPEMSTSTDATFLVRVNGSWLKDEIGPIEYGNALIIPNGVGFELPRTITRFVFNLNH